MDLLTYKILSEFNKHSVYNWDAVQNLVLLDADYYEFTVEKALDSFNRLKERRMIASIGIGNAYIITDEGKRLYSQLHQKFESSTKSNAGALPPISPARTISKSLNKHHPSKSDFFHVLSLRLQAYGEAIGNINDSTFAMQMSVFREFHLNKLRQWDRENELFSGSLWGYGFNRIGDGSEVWQELDVSEIRLTNGLNKHNNSFRELQLLSFQVRENALLVSTFHIDSCSESIKANLQTHHLLKNFSYARKVIRGQVISVEFHFTHLLQPIQFEIETYYIPGSPVSSELAEYYIQSLTKKAGYFRVSSINNPQSSPNFLNDLVEGIKALQEIDEAAECIRIHRAGKLDEASFRTWFIMWFKARNYLVEAEPEKGKGYIDLKAVHTLLNSSKIVEFKGWWNSDKSKVVSQVCRYLTEFEGDGYIFMINHTKSDIKEQYKELISLPDLKYVEGSWRIIKHGNSSYVYYLSTHRTIQGDKHIYHFIFQVHQ